LFPHPDSAVSRELAIVLTGLRRSGERTGPIHAHLLDALLASRGDRPQQIFYFYCLRLLHDGWTPGQKDTLLGWFDGMKSWDGGAYYRFFQEEILRQLAPIFTVADLSRLASRGEHLPWACTVLLRSTGPGQWPLPGTLGELDARLAASGEVPRGGELKTAIVSVLGRTPRPEAPAVLRAVADRDPSRRGEVARALAPRASADDWPYLVRGLDSTNPLVLFDVIEALRRLPGRPRPGDPDPFRTVLMAGRKLDGAGRRRAVALLRLWGGKRFGPEDGDPQRELFAWSTWYAQSFPSAPALPEESARSGASKYTVGELRAFFDTDPAGRRGDAQRGRAIYAKAQCLKCHRMGKEGEGVGPDLTDVAKKFDRPYILESILSPSKVISDQYRSTTVATVSGQILSGLAVPQGDRVVLLLSDGTKATLEKGEVESETASLVSLMPEGLLDNLSKAEIADLLRFLETGATARTEGKP
jgi:putative heme-binding domain-containing protein